MTQLVDFIRESNKIEGIHREPTHEEFEAHIALLALERITVDDLIGFVHAVAPGKPIRDRVGMNVKIGNHLPPAGGRQVLITLMQILEWVERGSYSPYNIHQKYESLHPFMDGNGRSGRVLWLWQMTHQVKDPYVLPRGFLHSWYYQSLEDSRHGRP